MSSDDSYVKALQIDKDIAVDYYQRSLTHKSEQMQFLESLLAKEAIKPKHIADICCGSGAFAKQLGNIYPNATFALADLNPEAISIAKSNVSHLNASLEIASIYELPLASDTYDLVICWQSLLDLERPSDALLSLVRICKPNGKIVVCSLFNFDFDVDIYAQVHDHTRASSREGIALAYNTISLFSVRRWLEGQVSRLEAHPFSIGIDLQRKGRGLGTFTVRTEDGKRFQVSGGMLMNWGILILTK